MATPNAHVARVRSSSLFSGKLRRVDQKAGSKPISMTIGPVEGEPEPCVQSMAFPTESWTAAQARAWAVAQGASLFEPAGPAAPRRKPASLSDGAAQDNLEALALACPSVRGFAAAGAQREDGGLPLRAYEKDVLHTGRFTHPKAGWTLEVTEEDLDGYVEVFGQMRAAGIKVPVTVDHGAGADDLIGEVEEMWRDGDVLRARHVIVGERGIGLAAQPAAEVSVEIAPEYTTTAGDVLGAAVVASSVCPRPVVPNQGRFVQVAASRLGVTDGDDRHAEAPVFTMSLADPSAGRTTRARGANTMDKLLKMARDMGAKDLADDAKQDVILAAIGAAWKQAQEAIAKGATDLESQTKLLATTQANLDAAKPHKLSREVEVLSRKGLTTELAALVAAAKLTPKAAEQLGAALNTTVMLSVGDKADAPGYGPILAALAENDPGLLGKQHTSVQTLRLGTGGTGDDEKRVDPDLDKRVDAAWQGRATG